ncbi:short chain dehydrogenase domain-containing protein [Ditylenchus destructor]|uniref:Short chain dehydrogenase domain-containing protein n=1 Tax=Ditylenchus destructor TaxID=166010 RepID=A0AAD4MUS4_9BILA|nr:short chain dehydrogenase domain-containing protein [Ditylenchus destructor]
MFWLTLYLWDVIRCIFRMLCTVSSKENSRSKNKIKDTESRQKFGFSSTTTEVLQGIDLRGKTIAITGTTSGIGLETARSLALHGAHVVMMNRNVELSENVRRKICDEVDSDKEHSPGETLTWGNVMDRNLPHFVGIRTFKNMNPQVDIIEMDLSSLKSVRQAAEEFISKGWPLDVLILNAGLTSWGKEQSADGHERTFAVNHLGHFYLTNLLMDKLRASAPSRLVVVSSELHAITGIRASDDTESKLKKLVPTPGVKYASVRLYAYSKLCNVLFANKVHRLAHQNGVHTYVLHPGVVHTDIARGNKFLARLFHFFATPYSKSAEQGAATTVYCAATPYTKNESGLYYENCGASDKRLDKALAHDQLLQDALWQQSMEFIKEFETAHK